MALLQGGHWQRRELHGGKLVDGSSLGAAEVTVSVPVCVHRQMRTIHSFFLLVLQ